MSQSHDIGYQKRRKAAPFMEAARLRRLARKDAKTEPSAFYLKWLRSGKPKGDK